jgi:hypothetical protein
MAGEEVCASSYGQWLPLSPRDSEEGMEMAGVQEGRWWSHLLHLLVYCFYRNKNALMYYLKD